MYFMNGINNGMAILGSVPWHGQRVFIQKPCCDGSGEDSERQLSHFLLKVLPSHLFLFDLLQEASQDLVSRHMPLTQSDIAAR